MDIKAFENNIGYHFKKTSLIELALTHSSTHHEISGMDYERLEFLGDRVVNLIIADLIFQTFPSENEGPLARRHTALVQTETLSDIARQLELNTYLMVSDAERLAGGMNNDNILADIFEAITAAIYLDGGFESAKKFIHTAFGNRIFDMKEPPRDPKTALQEWSQAQNLGLPIYSVVNQSGPDHAPEFTIQVEILNHAPQMATSTSKKRAEKDAAQKMLESINQ